MKIALFAAAASLASSTAAFAQTNVQVQVPSSAESAQAPARSVVTTLSAAPIVGLGLASAPSVGAAQTLAATLGAPTSRAIPSLNGPNKVCVFNFGVQVNGPLRNARVVNVDNARNLNLSCR